MTEITHAESHPRYGLVFLTLAAFTGLEIGASFLPNPFKWIALVALAATKAALVLMYFMHLKMDHRIYTMFFALGVVLALPMIMIIGIVMPMLIRAP